MIDQSVNQRRGRYVVLEGDEGAGKTTQLDILIKRLRAELHVEVDFVREPGGDPIAEQLRKIVLFATEPIAPLAETAIFSAARANMLHNIVVPKLKAGTWVTADRSYLSTMVYQGHGRGFSGTDFDRAVQLFAEPHPDLTIILDVSFETSKERLHERGGITDRFESESQEFRRSVNNTYRYFGDNDADFESVDGDRPLQEVAESIWSIVSSYNERWDRQLATLGNEPYRGLERIL